MNGLRLIAAIFFLAAFTACLDTEEYIVINKNNSGVYTQVANLSRMLEMMKQAPGQETGTGPNKMDSTLYVNQFMDTATNLSAVEKELFGRAWIRVMFDKDSSVLKIQMSCPFNSLDKLPEIKNNLYPVLNKIKLFDNLAGKEEGDAGQLAGSSSDGNTLSPAAGYFEFTAGPGKIAYTVKDSAAIMKAVATDSNLVRLQQMAALMGDITYKTSITTPTAIVHYTGNNPLLSADKRTITFSSTFDDMVGNPVKSSYSVTY